MFYRNDYTVAWSEASIVGNADIELISPVSKVVHNELFFL